MTMSRQDKATTEKFARTLRELVKRPDNRTCADCKRNDPRWASWNIGVFLCIRCSGIHRGMGTHISKVKSVDLDTWTPEQMGSIQKWGNYLANLYWEAHLRPGHIPPEHKMESFIRSKYESRRWALDGPPPADPSVLANSDQARTQASTVTSQLNQSRKPPQQPQQQISGIAATTIQQPKPHQLLSANFTSQRQEPVTLASTSNTATDTPVPQVASTPQNELFSLDFHTPAGTVVASNDELKKDVKQDILSLFSNKPLMTYTTSPLRSTPLPTSQLTQQPPATSMLGAGGVGMWGATSGWGATQAIPPGHSNHTGITLANDPMAMNRQTSLFDTAQIWGASTSIPTHSAPAQDPFVFGSPMNRAGPEASTKAKEDVFGDLWGGFK